MVKSDAQDLTQTIAWPIAWTATLADLDNLTRGQEPPAGIQRLRLKTPLKRGMGLTLILLDSSGSTIEGQGLEQALTLVQGLFQQAYRQRHPVGLMQFGNDATQVLIKPGRAPKLAPPPTRGIQAGGGTPLARGLSGALRLMKQHARRHPDAPQTLILLTDGRSRDSLATPIALESSTSAPSPLQALKSHPVALSIKLIDTEYSRVQLGRARALAQQLNQYRPTEYQHLNTLSLA